MPHLLIFVISFYHRLIGVKRYGIFVIPHGGYTPEWPIFSPIVRLVKHAYHHSIGRLLLNYGSDGIRAISIWEKKELIHSGILPNKISLMVNGLDKEALADHEKLASAKVKKLVHSWGNYFLSMGRVAVIKNYETTIQALASSNTNQKLVIVGPVQSTDYLLALKKLADRYGISDRVIFAGVMRGSDKYYLIRHATAFIHMAKWESFCNVVYEAQSQQALCIVADNTALSSLVDNGHTGIITPTFDYAKLGRILSDLNSGKLKTINSRVRKNLVKKSFPTWEVTAKEMEMIYKKIIKRYEK